MDEATIQAAQAGQRDAQAGLLRELQDTWYRVCLGLLGNAEDARDATQETALRFLKQLPQFAGQSRLKTWAIGIAINVAREMRRRRRHGEADFDGMTGGEAGPGEAAELAEQQAVLREVLKELPERQREALMLRYFEELSVEDAAAAMDCAPGTIKATVHQALRALRKRLMRR